MLPIMASLAVYERQNMLWELFSILAHLLCDNDVENESTWSWQTASPGNLFSSMQNSSPCCRLYWFSVIFSFPSFPYPTEMLWTHSTKFDGTWTSREQPRSQPTASSWFWIGPRTRRASLTSKSRICMRGSTADWRYHAWVRSRPKSAREKCMLTSSHTAWKVSVDIYIHLCLSMI